MFKDICLSAAVYLLLGLIGLALGDSFPSVLYSPGLILEMLVWVAMLIAIRTDRHGGKQ